MWDKYTHNPRPRKLGRLKGWNAQSIATSEGFPYRSEQEESHGGARYRRFTATESGEGPSLYVGKHSNGNWYVFFKGA